MAGIAETVAVLARELNTPAGGITQRARRLREDGLLPTAVGRNQPPLRIENVASLLLAVTADSPVKDASAVADTYAGLQLHGIDPAVMPPNIQPSASTVRDYLEHLLHSFASGSKDDAALNSRLMIEVVSNWPEVRIYDPSDSSTLVFVEGGTLPSHWKSDAVRKSVTITGRAIERCVRALQLTR